MVSFFLLFFNLWKHENTFTGDLENTEQSYILLFSHYVVLDSLWADGLQHARLPCPSPSPRVCSNSCPLSWWCHPDILSSMLQHQSFQWISELISLLLWFPCCLSKWLSRVFSSTTVQKLQFFGAQFSL